jgi:O-acetyl-ADP-ribose deacetylase (regulator of RNase III)
MLTFIKGNLLQANVEALVNTVNTVGVMGKGVALMFRDSYPANYRSYRDACERGEVRVGEMYITERIDLIGPRWIINFPTKQHWRGKSKIEWISSGLEDLKRVIRKHRIKSLALPPLGSGNGGLHWREVRQHIVSSLAELNDVHILVYEPSEKYQNVVKRKGREKLTPARALIAELVRRYWVLGFECSLLEIQKLAYFLERTIEELQLPNPLRLQFAANKYGPYAERLRHLLDDLDGSYLHCDKRLADAGPAEAIWFDQEKKALVSAYLSGPEAAHYRDALEATSQLIDGFQSPLGMELLATVDWLLHREGYQPTKEALREGLSKWPSGSEAAARKVKLFDDRLLDIALTRLS